MIVDILILKNNNDLKISLTQLVCTQCHVNSHFNSGIHANQTHQPKSPI